MIVCRHHLSVSLHFADAIEHGTALLALGTGNSLRNESNAHARTNQAADRIRVPGLKDNMRFKPGRPTGLNTEGADSLPGVEHDKVVVLKLTDINTVELPHRRCVHVLIDWVSRRHRKQGLFLHDGFVDQLIRQEGERQNGKLDFPPQNQGFQPLLCVFRDQNLDTWVELAKNLIDLGEIKSSEE